MEILQPRPVIRSPGRALMREDVRRVEMKNVDDVGIAQRLEEDHVVVVVPTGAWNEDGVLRRGLPDCLYDTGGDSLPAVSVMQFGLVEDLEEDAVGFPRGR